MEFVQCENGHFFDLSKYSVCPYCLKEKGETPGSLVTEITEIQKPEDWQITRFDEEERKSFYVTGWIVCVNGPAKGESYSIRRGMNWLGRSYDMDLIIMDDPAISRQKHCAVVYDERSNRFFILDGKVGLTYLNGQLLEGSAPLMSGDFIAVGNSKFEFIPFCREGHVWD